MKFRASSPHGSFVEVLPDIFFLPGSFAMSFALRIDRGMTVVRQNGELTVINSVRPNDEGARALDALGKVTQLVRLGTNHGADDAWFMDRYKPKLWAPANVKHHGDFTAHETLAPGNSPLPGARVFVWNKSPEVALLMPQHGGVLITCDAFQNWTLFGQSSFLGKLVLKQMKFGPKMVGPIWLKAAGPEAFTTFDEILAADFRHAFPGHGEPIKDHAKDAFKEAVQKARAA